MVPKLLGEIIVGIFMLITEAVLYFASADIPKQSAAYPRVLIITAFVLTVMFMANCVLQIKKEGLQKAKPEGEPGGMMQVIITMAIIILYLVLMPQLGFIVATPLFVIGIMAYLGMRSIPVLVLTPLCITLFGHFLFNNILYVFLPRGIFFG